jgi:hypothetical protein
MHITLQCLNLPALIDLSLGFSFVTPRFSGDGQTPGAGEKEMGGNNLLWAGFRDRPAPDPAWLKSVAGNVLGDDLRFR